ncbi:MAG: hypothetical protein CMK09_05735 [Ponticaulis sp.]|nr:hypothetical protein [Ponticaulis sp.]|tara:strand:- start:14456 stop:15679 length:1224 start_codon:yes stop_codon:yes gene_type:complete
MSERTGAPVITFRTALIAVIIGVVSFSALIVLSAFAPELRDKNQAGLHAYSKSALGYNFAVRLLQETGYEVQISRETWRLEYSGQSDLLILTPANRYDADELAEVNLDRAGDPTLIILPKRWGPADVFNRRYFGRTSIISPESVTRLLADAFEGITAVQTDPADEMQFNGRAVETVFTEKMQLITGDTISPIIANDEGVLFGRLEETDVYIVSDPELFNTHGLNKPQNAAVMLDIMETLAGDGFRIPVIFDTTLHGFERDKNLLRLLFEPPVLAATLFGIATALLLGWSAFLRFGRPREAPAEIATGRQSLIESTAGLFKQTEQQASLAEDYDGLATRLTLKSLGFAEDLPPDQADQILARRAEKRKEDKPDLPSRPDPSQVSSAYQLLHFAQTYHTWKEELSDDRE